MKAEARFDISDENNYSEYRGTNDNNEGKRGLGWRLALLTARFYLLFPPLLPWRKRTRSSDFEWQSLGDQRVQNCIQVLVRTEPPCPPKG